MSKFVMDERLKEYVGEAKTAAAQVAALFTTLRDKGKKFIKREAHAIYAKGKIMAELVDLEDAVERSGLTKLAIAAMLKLLPKHKGEGERRADKRQSFISLALECFYGLRRSSVSRWTRVVKKLKSNDVNTKDFSNVLRSSGGIDEYLNPAKKKASDRGGKEHDREIGVGLGAAIGLGGGDDHHQKGNVTITVSPKVQKALGNLKDGDVVAGVGMQKKGNKIRLILLSRDPVVCNLMARFIEEGKLLKTFGVDPKTLQPRRLKLDTSMLSSELH